MPRVPALLVTPIVAAIYFCGGRVGLSLAFVNASASGVWPPTGIALAAVLLLGRRAAPGVFLGAFLVNLATAGSFATSLGIACGNTLEAVVGAALVRRWAGGRNPFDRVRDVFLFVLVAGVLSTALSATVGVTTLAAGGLAHWGDYGPIWLTWWLGDAVSAVVVAPLIIVWASKRRPRLTREQWVEALCLAGLILLVSQAVFGGWLRVGGKSDPLEYLGIPLLLWAALRFLQHGAVTAAVLMSALAIGGTLRGSGPFAIGGPNESLLLLQAFMGTVTVTALVLAATRDAAQRASRMKDEFLATLSHELRTPLTPVMLAISQIELRPDLPNDLRDDVTTIRRNVELESQLIGDLLDLTRIARGKLILQFHEVDLHAVLRDAIDICRHDAGPRFVVELTATRHTVRADATRLQQVFWNLINNAQKFTVSEGTITIRSTDVPGARVRVEVSDTGIGIDPVLLPRLFGAFEQGEVRMNNQQAGLGLGLAISRKLVDAHAGSIAARSAGKGRGATFTVELPVVEASARKPAKPPDGPRATGRPLRILLVEDHEPTLPAMTKLLGTLGHRVAGAASVASARAMARQNEFDLLLSDLGLPDGSGLDLMRELRGQYAGKSIALTGYGMEQDIKESGDAGFAAHLIKPVDARQLEQAIHELVRQ